MIHPPQIHTVFKSTNRSWDDGHSALFSNPFANGFNKWMTNDYQYLLHKLTVGVRLLMADGTTRVPNSNECWLQILQTNPPPTSDGNLTALNGAVLDLPIGMPNTSVDTMDITVFYPSYIGYDSDSNLFVEQIGTTVYVNMFAELIRVPIFRNEY